MWKRFILAMILVIGGVLTFPSSQFVFAQTVKKIDVNLEQVESVGKTIQKALDEALKDQSGETLYEITLPKGTYRLDTLLKVFSYTTIKMDGCTLVRDEFKTMLRIGYEYTSYSAYNGIHDVTVIGGCFDGNGKDEKCAASIVRLGHGANIRFQNVIFRNVYDAHHVELAACRDVEFLDCIFKDFYYDGDVTNAQNREALQFDVMHTKSHFPKYPSLDDTPCKSITVSGCVFENLQRGLGTHSAVAGSYFENMRFINNEFRDVKGYAMIATNFKQSEISGNIIENCGSGILFRSMVKGNKNFYAPHSNHYVIDNDSNTVIKNNKIIITDHNYDVTVYGISLYGEKLTAKKYDAPKGDYTLSGVVVIDNIITMKNSGYGIWVQGAKDNKILRNEVVMNINASVPGKGNSDCIRLVKSKKIQIEKNTLIQKKNNKKTKEGCGIVLMDGSSAMIVDNKIQNSSKDGIFLNKKSKATIKKNTIKKTGRHGLNVCNKSVATVKKNHFIKCKKKEIQLLSGGKVKK